jgi:hypothetical protein
VWEWDGVGVCVCVCGFISRSSFAVVQTELIRQKIAVEGENVCKIHR